MREKMTKEIGFWRWLVTKGKFWLFLWLFCFAGMLLLDLRYGYNSIGGVLETVIWYVGMFPLLYLMYDYYLDDEKKK